MMPPHVPAPGRIGSLGSCPKTESDERTAVSPEEAGVVVPTLAPDCWVHCPDPCASGLVAVLVPLLVLAPLAFVIWSVAR